jgi:NTE family protein
MKTFALALGAGGARGLAHIAVFEALDELGLKPVAIAGSSIGAVAGAAYAAGMTGKALRHHVLGLAHNPTEVWRRLMVARSGKIGDLFGGDFSAMRLDPEKLLEQFLPDAVPAEFGALGIPLSVIASDLYGRREVVYSAGPLRKALASSIALPTIMRPVVIDDRVLIDGGATNPLPFDVLRGRADVILAVEISGPPDHTRTAIPSTVEAMTATVLLMAHSIVAEKLKRETPDVLLQPHVGTFRTLDFFQASAILRIAEPIKAELKHKLLALLKE